MPALGPITDMESVSINRTAARLVAGQGMTQSARRPAPLGTLRKARSQVGSGIWRGKPWYGRTGQAFALVQSGVMDKATANSLLRSASGHKQDDQTAKTKPPAGSCSRILDQSLGSMRTRSSKMALPNFGMRWVVRLLCMRKCDDHVGFVLRDSSVCRP